jgi:hypothetical protein
MLPPADHQRIERIYSELSEYADLTLTNNQVHFATSRTQEKKDPPPMDALDLSWLAEVLRAIRNHQDDFAAATREDIAKRYFNAQVFTQAQRRLFPTIACHPITRVEWFIAMQMTGFASMPKKPHLIPDRCCFIPIAPPNPHNVPAGKKGSALGYYCEACKATDLAKKWRTHVVCHAKF